jgi:hypothetical protein
MAGYSSVLGSGADDRLSRKSGPVPETPLHVLVFFKCLHKHRVIQRISITAWSGNTYFSNNTLSKLNVIEAQKFDK